MEFAVLGSLEVTDAGEQVNLGSPTPRLILGALLTVPGRTISTDPLIELIRSDDPPPRAAGSPQAHVSRLRKILNGDRVVGGDGGYRLGIEPVAVDAVRFEETSKRARSAPDPQTRLQMLTTKSSGSRHYGPICNARCAASMRRRFRRERLSPVEVIDLTLDVIDRLLEKAEAEPG